MTTKDEAWKAQAKSLHSKAATRRDCFDAGYDAGARVAVDEADTLELLEVAAEREWAVTLETSDEERFKVRVQQNPDKTVGGFRYWIAEPGERLGEETTRAEVLALLAGEEKKE